MASGGCSLYMPGGGSLNPSTHETVDKKMHYVHQDGGSGLQVRGAQDGGALRRDTRRNNIKGREIDAFIPHQANKRIITATADRLKMRPEAVIINIEQLWKHHRGDDSAGHGNRAPGRQIEEGKSGAAGFGGRRIHGWGDAIALGVLEARFQVSGLRNRGFTSVAPLIV